MVPGCLAGTRWGTTRLGSPTLAGSPVIPMRRCSGACLLARLPACSACQACLLCLLPCLWPRPLRGLWPRGPANGSGLWTAGAGFVCGRQSSSHQGQHRSADRMARGGQAARLQIATPHSSSPVATREAQARCSSSLGVIPAATNTSSCTRFKPALWTAGWSGCDGELKSPRRAAKGARARHARACHASPMTGG